MARKTSISVDAVESDVSSVEAPVEVPAEAPSAPVASPQPDVVVSQSPVFSNPPPQGA
jgi:hypothetical protein